MKHGIQCITSILRKRALKTVAMLKLGQDRLSGRGQSTLKKLGF